MPLLKRHDSTFDSGSQKMKCPYCDTEFEPEALKGYDTELQSDQADYVKWETSVVAEPQDDESEGLRSPAAKRSSVTRIWRQRPVLFGNPVVMMGQFAGAPRLDVVISINLDKKAANEGLIKHLSGKIHKIIPTRWISGQLISPFISQIGLT